MIARSVFVCNQSAMLKLIVALTLVTALPALADERKLTGAEIRVALSDKIVEGIDDSGRRYTQVFQKGGLTIYNVMPSSSSNGLWDVRDDQLCSQWPPGENWSCYDMTGDGPALTFIAKDGKLWPVKVLQ
jgi:hypothetical protein